MPQALGLAVFALIGNAGGIATWIVTSSIASTLIAGIGTAALAFGGMYLKQTLMDGSVPKAADGKYNLKQNVPSLVRVYGRVAKGGDYAALEERDGIAYHVIVHASHRIHGFVEHWLHDETVTLDGSGYVTAPTHFAPGYVNIQTRRGENAEVAYGTMVAVFPEIWTNDHRGDGLATVLMAVPTVPPDQFQDVYPQQMPLHRSVEDGVDEIYDPRTDGVGFTRNLALIRMDHLMHPSGGARCSLDDLDLSSWSHAADVCDETVTNRTGGSEPRYYGGFWYRYSSDQVEVGRLVDQAAQMVIYETAEGKIAVHAGEMSETDVRLTGDDILALEFDANRNPANTVLAMRGTYIDPAQRYNEVDAAPYGTPYLEDGDQRTRTLSNQVVQSHNHCARLLKPAYIRANAPRISIRAHFEAARNVPYRRYIRVHRPPRLNEALVEIIGRPVLSLASMTYEFTGIVIPETIYDFDAATEEGAPGTTVTPLDRGTIPVPTGFSVTIGTEDIGGGQSAAYALAEWTHVSDALNYQLEWEPTSGGAVSSVTSANTEDSVRTGYLVDGQEYRFRLRAWSVGSPSTWTGYVNRTATADPVAPAPPSGVSASRGAGSAGLAWTTPNSANFASSMIWRSTANDFSTAILVDVVYSAPSSARTYTNSGLAAGTYYFWITAANGSGVESAEVATGAVIIT